MTDKAQYPKVRFYVSCILFFCLILISGCEMFPVQNTAASLDTVTLTPVPIDATATPMCFWNWAYNNVPDEQLEPLRQSLNSAGYADFELTASSYGEDYVCQSDGKTISSTFHLMDITPKVLLPVDSLSDTTALGAHIRQIITILETEETNLLKIGRIEITFSDGTDTIFWSAPTSDYTFALNNEITDDDLFVLGTG